MGWVGKRVLIVWLTMAVICAAVIVVARLNPAPDVLQSLGFGVCDGEPCFRGIKAGMDWNETIRKLPDIWESNGALRVAGYTTPMQDVYIAPSYNGKVVRSIGIGGANLITGVSVGQLIAEYGYPCKVFLLSDNGLPYAILFGNAKSWMTASIDTDAVVNKYSDLRLRPETPINAFAIVNDNGTIVCNAPGGGVWQGFTSADVYQMRFLNMVGIPDP